MAKFQIQTMDIYSAEERGILERYGTQFEALTDGVRAPTSLDQERFVEVFEGDRKPETKYERVWWKYRWRLAWESCEENRAAMGPPPTLNDDGIMGSREDTARIRGHLRSRR